MLQMDRRQRWQEKKRNWRGSHCSDPGKTEVKTAWTKTVKWKKWREVALFV